MKLKVIVFALVLLNAVLIVKLAARNVIDAEETVAESTQGAR